MLNSSQMSKDENEKVIEGTSGLFSSFANISGSLRNIFSKGPNLDNSISSPSRSHTLIRNDIVRTEGDRDFKLQKTSWRNLDGSKSKINLLTETSPVQEEENIAFQIHSLNATRDLLKGCNSPTPSSISQAWSNSSEVDRIHRRSQTMKSLFSTIGPKSKPSYSNILNRKALENDYIGLNTERVSYRRETHYVEQATLASNLLSTKETDNYGVNNYSSFRSQRE